MKYSRKNAGKIIMAGVMLGLMAMVVNKMQGHVIDGTLPRPDAGEEASEYELKVRIGDETLEVPMEVSPRMYDENEVNQHFSNVEEKLSDMVRGENESLEQVKTKLQLVTEVDQEGIEIQWFSSDYSLVDTAGVVHNENMQEGEERSCVIKAVLSYGQPESEQYEKQIEYEITVVAPDRTEEEKKKFYVERMLKQANLECDKEGQVQLPEQIDGEEVQYIDQENEIPAEIFPILAVVAVAVLYLGDMADKKRRMDMRARQLRYDYSEVISKLTLLTGAGMTFRRAWEKIVTDYERAGKSTRYVYEEMRNTLYEMKAGISELEAYERFGKRCNVKEYLKLAALLQQNLKKGSKGLGKMLEEEVEDAFDLRKNLAIQQGEEAGTKLLLPMTIMLLVVMMIVMVPALMSFQV
ncbi:MAG: type II secretion system F family protein [Lachnospira sp.]|nr:type II secretion system F family protein [Lachnospira sp.]